MLSSIILSLTMNTTPAPMPSINVANLELEQVGRKRGQIKINDKFDIEEIGRKRGQIKINDKIDIEEICRKLGQIKL